MSLVNDMLRDLDRRRDGPSRPGVGAERLVPVADSRSSGQSRSLVSFVLAVVVSLLLITGAFYFWQRSSVPVASVQPAFTPAPPAPVQQAIAEPEVNVAEIQEMERRMQELEAQNRALREAQTAVNVQSASAATASPQVLAPLAPQPTVEPMPAVESVVLTEPAVPDVSQSQPEQAASPAPAGSPVESAVAVADTTGGLIRSPRAMSFAERDQMQVQDALRLVSAGQVDQAVRQLREFLDANPTAHQSRETIVKLALQRGESAVAQTLLDAGLALDSARPGYRKLQARILLGNGQAPQAVTLLSSRPPSVMEDIEYHDLLATAYLSSQDYESAATTYESLVQQNRSEARWWYGLASAWDALGRNRDAALAYEQAMKLPSLSASLRQRSQQRIAEIGL